jgi:hypothetical protein
MNKALSTVTAAAAGVGLALASTSAKAFVPVVLAAIIGGSVLGGAVLGGAASNANNGTSVAPTVASEPAVTVNSTTCYFTHRWINGVRHRVRVCTGQPVAAAPAPAVVPEYRYGYGAAVPVYGYGYYATAPAGNCDVISGQRVCFP